MVVDHSDRIFLIDLISEHDFNKCISIILRIVAPHYPVDSTLH